MSVKYWLCLAVAAGAIAGGARAQSPVTGAERTADGKPNLGGVWFPRKYQDAVRTTSGDLPPFLPWAAERYRQSVAAQDAGKPLKDSSTECLPHGMPRLMFAPYPMQILQKKKQVTILFEVNHLVRMIYMDEPQSQLSKKTYLGHSVGHWSGDFLVVDTANLNDKTLIDRAGTPHTEALHLVEHLSLLDGGKTLDDTITVEDKNTFSKPFIIRVQFTRRPDVQLMEYVCVENNRNG